MPNCWTVPIRPSSIKHNWSASSVPADPLQVPPGRPLGLYPDDYLDIGLGRQPELTGQGTGFAFCSFVLETVNAKSALPLRLTVASFNERAIHLYEQLGFRRQATFSTTHATFLIMTQSHT